MPKKVINDYTFYKIVCLDNSVELCYVGSTANFNKRRNTHKSSCNNENCKEYNFKIYKTIRENGGWSNFKMVEIGKKEQIKVREAETIEEHYRQEIKANMNGRRCFTTEQQKQEYQKNYREKNKNYQQNYHKEYNEANKDRIKEQKRTYCEANKDRIKEQKRTYCEANKDRINEKLKCECGCVVIKRTLLRHKKTPKHIKLIEMKTNETINI
tara:strand:+ start:28 stop:663 length:636 start_codon:yes stop_codon:yes gene_type:complete